MLFVGDHPVMDLLNTVYRGPDGIMDAFTADTDIVTWAHKAGIALGEPSRLGEGELVAAAVELREVLRSLLTRAIEGKPLRPASLNAILAQARSHLVVRDGGIQRKYESGSAMQVLAPLAELAAEFLTTADFSLVRRCEGKDCVLWFYDRTRSHRRRWCSMAACGNRAKVAAFRAR